VSKITPKVPGYRSEYSKGGAYREALHGDPLIVRFGERFEQAMELIESWKKNRKNPYQEEVSAALKAARAEMTERLGPDE
jgi:hypothetical protein